MSDFEIHPQLRADCHRLGRLGGCHVLLHRNAVLPWFIVVPETSATDLLDLDSAQRDRALEACGEISRFVKQELGFAKVNFAAIGNLVPQMHLHVVGRREGDACWPAPVWGHLESESVYSEERVEEIARQLEAYGLARS